MSVIKVLIQNAIPNLYPYIQYVCNDKSYVAIEIFHGVLTIIIVK